jgi:choline dehydrogenase-like flavoprotein
MGALEAEVERLQVAIDAVVPADDFPSASEAGGLRFWSLITGSERPDSADRKGSCTGGIGIFDDVVNDLGAGPVDLHPRRPAWQWRSGGRRHDRERVHATTATAYCTSPENEVPSSGQHQAGTCRMGTDPATSVTDPYGQISDHPNLRAIDGSLHVTNGGVTRY